MVMDVMAAAARIEAAGGHVIHMEVGQPAAGAPKTAIAAAQAALATGRIDYTSALGIPSLRERIARHYRDAYGCDVSPERIVVTTGSSGGFILAFLSMFEPGDRVAVTVPGYPPYRHILTALGCEPVLIETTNETRHALTGEALLAAHRKAPLKGVLVGSPANPTGTMMSREALAGLIAAAEDAVTRGEPMSGVFTSSKLVNSSVAEAIRNGERTGKLGTLLLHVADYLDEENEIILKALTSVVEPIILIVMGAFVGFVAVSMFLPLFDLVGIAQGGHK